MGYEGQRLAACRRIALPIADIQHENPGGVGKGRLLTLSCHLPVSAFGRTDLMGSRAGSAQTNAERARMQTANYQLVEKALYRF